MANTEYTTLEAAGREIRLSSPSKVYFPRTPSHPPFTKLDLAEYHLRLAGATVNHLRKRPTVLKRWRAGITGDFFIQKRVPEKRPEWLQTATVSFPSGRSVTELVPNDDPAADTDDHAGRLDRPASPSACSRPRPARTRSASASSVVGPHRRRAAPAGDEVDYDLPTTPYRLSTRGMLMCSNEERHRATAGPPAH